LEFSSEHTAFIAVPLYNIKRDWFFVRETQFCFCDSEVNLYTRGRKISSSRKLNGRHAFTEHDKVQAQHTKKNKDF